MRGARSPTCAAHGADDGPRLGPGSATLRRARWTQRSSAPPCGRRYTVVTDGLSSSCSAASAPMMIRCSWLATASSRPSCSAWTGAAELARKLVVGLRQRGWTGDDELADQLEAQLGGGRAAMLRALPVDLDELAGILEGDPLSIGGRIDITTGEVWPQAAIEYALETGEEDEDTSADPERWLPVHGEGSREGYRTWSCSSRPSRIPAAPSAWPSRSKAAARFAASRTSLPAGPASSSDGTHCPRSASAAARDHGSRRPATACCRSTTAIPENGPPARYQPELGTSPRARGGAPDTRSGVRPRVSFIAFVPSGIAGPASAKATFRVLAEGDPDVDAALASAVGCPPPPRSLTPPRPPLSDQTGRAARLRRCPDCPKSAVRAVPSRLPLFVLATQEFVANGGGRPSRRRQSASSPGRMGSRGRVGRRVVGGVPTRNSRRLVARLPSSRVDAVVSRRRRDGSSSSDREEIVEFELAPARSRE